MDKSSKKSSVLKWLFLIVPIIIGITIYLNRVWIYDFYRGKTYQPSNEMIAIRDKLNLTSYGRFLFDSGQPMLNSEEEFNANCHSFNDESAVLGCYTQKNIYIYNITEPSLNGIRELTAAHELLHAMYERMSVEEKDSLRTDLEKIYRDNQSILKDEIETYDSSEQMEEIYVRVGTEIKNLTPNLEEHFAKIFNDQDEIVDFYDSYIVVFREIENELDTLKSEMDILNQQINDKTREYERRVGQLNADIISFNSCANTVGCFDSENNFNVRRGQLVTEQSALESLYNEIDNLINEYNLRVEKYNSNVMKSKKLQNIINSHIKVEDV